MEMAAKARDAEQIARVQKHVDAEVDRWVRFLTFCPVIVCVQARQRHVIFMRNMKQCPFVLRFPLCHLTTQAADKSMVEMLRTIGQVWPPAAAKVATTGTLPGSTKKAKMQVLRMVHPDKVRVVYIRL